jgi:hypothetical protein
MRLYQPHGRHEQQISSDCQQWRFRVKIISFAVFDEPVKELLRECVFLHVMLTAFRFFIHV